MNPIKECKHDFQPYYHLGYLKRYTEEHQPKPEDPAWPVVNPEVWSYCCISCGTMATPVTWKLGKTWKTDPIGEKS